MRNVLTAARAGEWWEHKLAPVLGTGYTTAFMLGASVAGTAGTLAVVLLALLPGALYVSVLNDLTDREADRLAGKRNRLAGAAPGPWWAAVGAAVLAGAAIGALAWRDDPAVLAVYAGAWVAFALYSVPPVRLKGRGAAGVVADAAGAHLFPHLLVVAAVLAAAGRALGGALAVAAGAWALAHGLRGALWHQLADAEADARSGLRTFGREHPELARRLGAYVAFPVEALAFAALLVAAGGAVAGALLPLYVLLELRRARRWGAEVVVVAPARSPAYRIALNEFYVALYPLAFLVASSVRHPRDLLVLAVHVAVFPRTLARLATDAYNELRHPRLPARAIPHAHEPHTAGPPSR
ncbi:MAG TPA: UbiA family prenyltransferase [Solirubrobacteraceae bacterium]|jgi:4-hydroxybenzoate polyprenyltransferase|nr:UbiA family prenyltransferase [Solirubrobacteraceae bacterium]